MKRILIVLLITLLVLALLGAVGVLLFRHFVTDQITDRGGMENPDAGLDAVYSPCGADLCRPCGAAAEFRRSAAQQQSQQ